MSTLTPELNLVQAVDDDDTADYLTLTNGLKGSLAILDGLFNSSTGHTHNGAHQGGALQFQNLTVGANLTVVGSSTFQGSVTCQSTLTVTGVVNSASTFQVGQDLSVGRDLSVTRNATITGTLTSGAHTATGLTINGAGSITGNLSVGGLLAPARVTVAGIDYGAGYGLATSTGIAQTFWYQRGNGAIRCWDNQDFTFSTTNTGNALVQRDANGAISDPKIAANVDIAATAYTFPTVSGNAGLWRYVKAWGGNRVINLTNGTFILDRTQYTSGQYTLQNGDSVSCYCDGSNWWVL
jgi:hypothetical protein